MINIFAQTCKICTWTTSSTCTNIVLYSIVSWIINCQKTCHS